MNAVRPDRRIKRYELLDEVGRGGMAVVYRGRDTALDRVVAVKVLHPHLASRPDSARRFHREARAVARLRHRNIVEIYDTSSADDRDVDQQFIVTEFVDGGTLRDIVEDGPGVPFPCVGVALVLELCDALEHAHELGIIHRDIKPENVMVAGSGAVKLMDFGIAQVLDADRMTASGSLLGSPAHMPPEIVDGKVADFRSDIFSLGTVLYYVTVNALPFAGNSPTAVLRNIMESRYEEPARANPRIGRRLACIIRRCLQTDPDDRYQTVAELADALHAELDSLGLEDHVSLARDFLKDLEGFEDRFRPAHVERMLERAQDAVDANEVACATDWINRVLAIEMGNERALDLLERLGSRRRNRMIALATIVCVALFGVGWAATWFANQRSAEQEAIADVPAPAAETAPAEIRTNAPSRIVETELPDFAALQSTLRERLTAGVQTSLDTLAPVGDWLRGGLRGGVDGASADASWRPPERIATATPSIVPRPRTDRPREDRRPRDDEESTAGEPGTDATAAVEVPIETQPPAPTTVSVAFTVFPSEARAWPKGNVAGARGPDELGFIRFDLPVGRHTLVVGGGRLHEKSVTVEVTAEHVASGKPPRINARNNVAVEWSDARVIFKSPDHYQYIRVDGGEFKHVPPEGYWDIEGKDFDFQGSPVVVEAWALPVGVGPRNLTERALREFAYRSVELKPGDHRPLLFE